MRLRDRIDGAFRARLLAAKYFAAMFPLGDFFGVGHGVVGNYQCAVLNMSANAGQNRRAAMNCLIRATVARASTTRSSGRP